MNTTESAIQRPQLLNEFVGQNHIKEILEIAISSSIQTGNPLGHTLFSGPSGYGKTTLSTICASLLGSKITVITGYAFSKPSEMISVLNGLGKNDVLFIDEIHRLKPTVEEVLYVAMEDYRVDMILPDGSHISLPLSPFTLIGATTKNESLSNPLKNRFIYKHHLIPYSIQEKCKIIERYLTLQGIKCSQEIVHDISLMISSTPREIANSSIQLKDYLISKQGLKNEYTLDMKTRSTYRERSGMEAGGLTPIHRLYLDILDNSGSKPVGLSTLAAKLGVSEKAVEIDIEPLLFQLAKIEKTERGRILVDSA